jgi:DNA (cytosine-5)-methyltransferase 1
MSRPRILDLFCGAGGASVGYHRAGFEVIGVDINPQPNYPFRFHQQDALEFLADNPALDERYDAIHASPPCQAHTPLKNLHGVRYAAKHLDLVGATRTALIATGLPWVMENVTQAPLLDPVVLCGSMFDLPVRRHRAFEASFPLPSPACNHKRWAELWPDGFHRDVSKERQAAGTSTTSPVVGVYGNGGGPGSVLRTWRWAMGTHWMGTKHEIAESIPPEYTRYVGGHLMNHVRTADWMVAA